MTGETEFRKIFSDIWLFGRVVAPRDQIVRELEDYSYKLPPYARFCSFASRRLSLPYIKREFLWYLRGDRFDTSICEHARTWRGLVNPDGSINSNYGQYIFGAGGQFDNVVETLASDPDSRRASIVILDRAHLLSDTKDVPCTYALNFRVRRGGCLNMSVHMRSQDAIYGMGNDAPAFSMVHEMVAAALSERLPGGVRLGTYHHSADSLHVYERHFEMLDLLRRDDSYLPVRCPRISGADEVRYLRAGDFSDVPPGFEFTRWLLDVEGTEGAQG